jgi:outer membrane lipoprotein-sorting protein
MKRIALGIVLYLCFSIQGLSSEIIPKIEESWNQITTMSGQFQQTDRDGSILYGKFYFLKPYKSKFVYTDKKENIVTNESLLFIVDQDGYKIESYAIRDNILKKLLSNEVIISEEFDLIKLETDEKHHQLQLKIRNDSSDNRVNVFFDLDSLDLKKWHIFDEFGDKTVLEFTKIKKNIFISENLFVVKYK